MDALVPLPNSGPGGLERLAHLLQRAHQLAAGADPHRRRISATRPRRSSATRKTPGTPWRSHRFGRWASYDTIKTPFDGPGESAVFHMTHTFKPTLMNEFVAAYTTDHIFLYNAGRPIPWQDPSTGPATSR